MQLSRAGWNWAYSCWNIFSICTLVHDSKTWQHPSKTHTLQKKKKATIVSSMMNYSVFLSASWTLLFFSVTQDLLYDHVGALHMAQQGVFQPNIFCRFGPSSQAWSCLPAQTRESSGSIWGPDVENSWQASWVCVTNCVAEQSGCCDSVTPAGSAQWRKSISGTSNSVGILQCLGPKDNGPIREKASRWDGDVDSLWRDFFFYSRG